MNDKPFGKHRGRLLIDLPEPYIVWFAKQGFSEDKLGRMLQAVYEIKVNGLEYLFTPLRNGVSWSPDRNGTSEQYTPTKKIITVCFFLNGMVILETKVALPGTTNNEGKGVNRKKCSLTR